MKEDHRFDDIRPYVDDEISAAMRRIAASTSFPLLASYAFPGQDVARVKDRLEAIRTTDEFQAWMMRPVIHQVICRTMTEFTYEGLEHLTAGQPCLFIGNHRDIVLDSSLMQYVLFCNGHETTEITFGANLMQNQLVVDLGKSNKMFRVERPGGGLKEFYLASLHLSEYIRHVVCNKRRSVWMAQRNGRTKDGLDQTDQGILKMLGLSRTDDKVDSIAELHITPVAISYEWEPCDVLKTLELYEKRQMGRYIKKPGEDINSILTGIAQPKGRVHLAFCPPLTRGELAAYDTCTQGDFNRAVAALIDRRICAAYRLTPNNYLAHDLRYGKSTFADRYTSGQKADFIRHLCSLKAYEETCNLEELTDLLLGIYSNPVESARSHETL